MGDDDKKLVFADNEKHLELQERSKRKKCRAKCKELLKLKDEHGSNPFKDSNPSVKCEELLKQLNHNLDDKFEALSSVVFRLNADLNTFKDALESLTKRTRKISD